MELLAPSFLPGSVPPVSYWGVSQWVGGLPRSSFHIKNKPKNYNHSWTPVGHSGRWLGICGEMQLQEASKALVLVSRPSTEPAQSQGRPPPREVDPNLLGGDCGDQEVTIRCQIICVNLCFHLLLL